MGTESIVEHIPNLTPGAANLAQRMDREPKNRYGIPTYHLQPRDRPEVEATQTFIRKVNMHLMQLLNEAEAAGGYLVELPEINDPWEQRTLMLKVGRMRSKGNSVTRYPWDPADVLYLDHLVNVLKGIISENEPDATDEAPANQQPLTDSQRIQHLEDTMQQVVATLRNNNIIL